MHATGKIPPQQAEIKKKPVSLIAVAEFSPQAHLRSADENWLQLTGYTIEEIVDAHHSIFCEPAFSTSKRYAQIWQKLVEGEYQNVVIPYVHQNGSIFALETKLTPVKNASGEISGIVATTAPKSTPTATSAPQQHLERLAMAAEASQTAIVISHPESGIEYVNPGFTRLFGWTNEEACGQAPFPLLCTDKSPQHINSIRSRLAQGDSVEDEEMMMGKDGQRYWVTFVSTPIIDELGRWQRTISTLTDITRTKTYEVLQQHALEAMVVDKPLTEILDTICTEVERLAPEITVSILEVDEKGLLHPLASPSLPSSYTQLLDGLPIGPNVGSCGTAAWRKEPVRVDDIAANPLWINYREAATALGFMGCWSTPICNNQGNTVATFAFYFKQPRQPHAIQFHQLLVDASTHLCALALEREKNRKQIRQLAFYDPLTGLPNHSLMVAKAEQALEAARIKQEQLAILFIDIDRFKQINDLYGHPSGNELLKQVALRIKGVLSAADIIGRPSGDEFVAVLPNHCNHVIVQTVEKMQQVLSKPIAIAGTSIAITASIGIAMYPVNGRDIETLLHRADMAMYQAKSTGRGRYSFFNAQASQQAQERLMLNNALQDAIENQELHFVYQPQWDIQTGSLYGVEALARWTHQQLGEVSPATFIPLAEENGHIAKLGIWALTCACQQLHRWRSRGLTVPSISVNLSPSSFHSADIVQTIEQTLNAFGLNPQDLTLEITEEILMDNSTSTIHNIEAVHALGVRISMDDFGVGYSSLSYLRKLPVSELKLDLSFVVDLEHNPTAQELSRAIRGIAVGLHLTVVAEGVETEQQLAILKRQGYNVAQGHLISRPLAANDFEQWLSTPNKPAS